MSVIPWHELEESFRMTGRNEWWVPVEFVGGGLVYVAWVASTWHLAIQVTTAFDIPLQSGTPAPAVVGALAILWLLVPALAAMGRIRTHILNFRRNVDRFYRYERPGTLMIPPVVYLYVALIGWILLETLQWYLYALFVLVTLHLLTRALAYSYRVFAFSHPYLMHLLVLVSLLVQLAVAVRFLADALGETELFAATISGYGLGWTMETISLGGIETELSNAIAIALPVALVGAYLLVQLSAAVVIRYVQPDVTPADIRGGQRYPPAVRTADGGGLAASATGTGANAGGSRGSASTASGSGSSPADAEGGPGAMADAPAGGDGQATSDGEPEDVESDEEDEDEQSPMEIEEESVSHTRVFTPPADDEYEDARELAQDHGSSSGADTVGSDGRSASADGRSASADGPSAGDDGDHCESCGEFVPDSEDVQFCPACGRLLE